jgi:2,4-diaminopentanoate dehydrogenase
MKKIRVLQVGLGPLGQKITRYLLERESLEIVGAVDTDLQKCGQDLGTFCGLPALDITIEESLEKAIEVCRPDIAVLTTVSDMKRITPQILSISGLGVSVVSTCEELSYPWDESPELSKQIDETARANNVAVVGTGVNPGFLMDSFPVVLTAVCQKVEEVKVSRIQNAQFRRLPFQKKIGAGLTLVQFEEKKQAGTLRHVGLTESIQMIAARLGWKLDRVEDILSPIVAQKEIRTDAMTIPAGDAAGVQQIGRGYVNGKECITLTFRASVGEPKPEDTIEITGEPNIVSTIKGGVNGDIATCAITINTIPQLLRAAPGLHTMVDIPVVSSFNFRSDA